MQHCTQLLICPFCSAGLTKVDKTLKCSRGHSFDIAHEGYVYLLHKKSSGDTKAMLLARRNFLERGYYSPLSNTLNELVYNYLIATGKGRAHDSAINILDAGCGEGYYLGRLKLYLDSHLDQPPCCYLGLDISKEAVKMAARQHKEIDFVVASINERLGLADNSVQVLLNIFAPRNPGEFARVLSPGGLLVVIIPNPQHLLSLRTRLNLLNIEENKQQHVIDSFRSLFELRNILTVEYDLSLGKEEIQEIVNMTPNFWHISREASTGDNYGRPARKNHPPVSNTLEHVQTEATFTCLLFSRL